MYTSFLPLGATAQGELWPPEQSASVRITWWGPRQPAVSSSYAQPWWRRPKVRSLRPRMSWRVKLSAYSDNWSVCSHVATSVTPQVATSRAVLLPLPPHPRLIIRFLNNLVFTVWGCYPHAQPPIWRIM
jgi:hypothetical protein